MAALLPLHLQFHYIDQRDAPAAMAMVALGHVAAVPAVMKMVAFVPDAAVSVARALQPADDVALGHVVAAAPAAATFAVVVAATLGHVVAAAPAAATFAASVAAAPAAAATMAVVDAADAVPYTA